MMTITEAFNRNLDCRVCPRSRELRVGVAKNVPSSTASLSSIVGCELAGEVAHC